jgi:hypothetical protein
MDRMARTDVFVVKEAQMRSGERRPFIVSERAARLFAACADTVPQLFHRSCGKVCGKGALESYKFLKILYF